MSVVVDSNLVAAIVGDDRTPIVASRFSRWLASGEDLHAPQLLRYEVANALTRLITANAFPQEGLSDAWRSASGIPITLHPLDIHGPEVVAMALRLGRRSAYDAAYLALAERLEADLWTFDGPLARNASSLGFRVHLVERTTPPDGR